MINEKTPNVSPPAPQNKQSESSQQTPQPPKPPQKLVGRKIPQTMICSYDLITLKQGKRPRNIKPIPCQSSIPSNPQIQKLKPIFGQCSCTYDLKYQFIQTIYQLNTSLVLSKFCHIKLINIIKIRFIGTNNQNNDQLQPNQIKITWQQNQSQQEENIIIKPKTNEQTYFLFASIIVRRMLLQDFFLVDMIYPTSTSFEGYLPKIEGQIYKSSPFFGTWQKKQIKLDQKLTLYNKQKQEIKCIKNIVTLWTRFSMHNGYFIIKISEGLKKTQLGIPLVDFTNLKCQKNWLFLLSRLIK